MREDRRKNNNEKRTRRGAWFTNEQNQTPRSHTYALWRLFALDASFEKCNLVNLVLSIDLTSHTWKHKRARDGKRRYRRQKQTKRTNNAPQIQLSFDFFASHEWNKGAKNQRELAINVRFLVQLFVWRRRWLRFVLCLVLGLPGSSRTRHCVRQSSVCFFWHCKIKHANWKKSKQNQVNFFRGCECFLTFSKNHIANPCSFNIRPASSRTRSSK